MFNIDVVDFYPQNEKYDMARFMRYDETDQIYDILDSKFIKQLQNIPQYGIKVITVEEGKPSLLCESIYGYFNWQYWWIIMEFNNLIGPDDLVAGMIIKYPLLNSLDILFSSLNPKFN